ncbi:hypothetical protein PSAC2689_200086 [Paraburkholderia sacchari]
MRSSKELPPLGGYYPAGVQGNITEGGAASFERRTNCLMLAAAHRGRHHDLQSANRGRRRRDRTRSRLHPWLSEGNDKSHTAQEQHNPA